MSNATPRFRTSRSTLLVDRVMTWFITVGGIGIIAAVLAIGLFIFVQVVPLFRGASVTTSGDDVATLPLSLATTDDVAVLGIDEWGAQPFVLGRSGTLAFLGSNAPAPQALTAGRPITASAYDEEHQRIALGFADGTAALASIAYHADFSQGNRQVQATASIGEPLRLADHGTITSIAWGSHDDQPLVAAVVEAPASIELPASARLLATLANGSVQDATALVAGTVKSVLTDHHGEFILAISGQGDVTYLQRIDADGGKLAVRQTFRPFADKAGTTGDASISAAFLLFGDVSLVAVDARGANRIFSLHRKPGEQQRTWGLTRELDPLPGTIRFSSHSTRNKSFLLGSDQCVSLRHATSAAVRWEQPAEVQPLMGVLGPKYDRIAVLGADRQVRLWPLHDRHPEAGLRAFFGEVWYEGYSEPRHEWQSTGGTDDFEPKLSMVVLMWGTLKATFYALLFAIPIALLGAIYTAEFMHPRFKAIIKPTVEIMAALPSVVLGFLAALWLAPAIENRFPSVLMVFLLVPLAACAIGFTWSRLPPSARALVRPGREFLALGPALLLVAWLGWLMGPVVERLFFTVQIDGAAVADFRRWWAATTGLAYEQRNSLVVGVMMGFAVIPIIFTIAEDALSNVPPALRSGSLALGASRWQTALRVVVPTASPGIFSGMMIGLGRAIGETMIVVMATGNTGIIDWNPFNGMRTLSANIAVELPEAPHGSTLYRSLFLGALLLFIFTFAVNTAAEILRTQLREKYKTV